MTDHQDERFIREFYRMKRRAPEKHSRKAEVIVAIVSLAGLAVWFWWALS